MNRYTLPLAAMLCISLLSSCTNNNETETGSSTSTAESPSSSSSLPSSSSVVPSSSSVIVAVSCDMKYRTVVIGSQTWMAENLNCDVEGSKCYSDDPANCSKYGRLYNWKTAMVVCPKGWHLPSDNEWYNLIYFVGDSISGAELKAKSGWYDDGNGTDTYGFSALPGGIGESDGKFRDIGEYGVWWSSRENYEYDAYGWLMYYGDDFARYSVGVKEYSLSVRCLKD